VIDRNDLISSFKLKFCQPPEFFSRAPGRVNLIGEHTDYNGGFVMPAAIDRDVAICASVSSDDSIELFSKRFDDSWEGSIHADQNSVKQGSWASYFLAVYHQFREEGYKLSGLKAVVDGDVPAGAGLSSSAAYEVASATLLNQILESEITPRDIALLAQRAEHSSYVGVKCGIMDQFASAMGKAGQAIKLDCHSLDFEYAPFPSEQAALLIINSMKKRGLVDSEYNARRKECDDGLDQISKLTGKTFESLRHIPVDAFEAHREKLSEKVQKRVYHNLTENDRVQNFASLLASSELKRAGVLMYESHASLRDDFEVSCAELDKIVKIAESLEGVYGCRMTGAGFGGCAVALIERQKADSIAASLRDDYEKATGLTPDIYISRPSSGARVELL
jgi:galactokinase